MGALMTTVHVLVDNTAAVPGLVAEHGLALALEFGQGELWLWDTGKSSALLENACSIGLDIGRAKGLALSHGHHDHTGGLPALAEAGFAGPVYAHPHAARVRFRCSGGAVLREIGWRGGDADIVIVRESQKLLPGLVLHTDIPRRPDSFQAVEHFFLDQRCSAPDMVEDDAFLLVQGVRGSAVILGCCHAGLGNSLAALEQRTGLDRVETVIGGLHLYEAPPWAVEEAVEVLRSWQVKRVYAGHCTGEAALRHMAAALPGVIHPLGSGLRVDL
jgi:7,8-dihydropterin-6-yl-methyl-4-(beta-D-ribofuranosyl)aminobenzene 5'-phosphate synthase